MLKFFKLYRRRGFGETLEILNGFKKKEAVQTTFFNSLKKKKSYLNSFFRVKDDLIKNGLIAYKLNQNYEKVIYLTEKGIDLNKRIDEIEDMFRID
jgi:predicted transcriptional regulator